MIIKENGAIKKHTPSFNLKSIFHRQFNLAEKWNYRHYFQSLYLVSRFVQNSQLYELWKTSATMDAVLFFYLVFEDLIPL